VGVQLNFTVTDANGKPLVGATAVEKVKALEGAAIEQNQNTVPLDNQGRGTDFVTNSAPTPTSLAAGEALIEPGQLPSSQNSNLTSQ
jgi:hypothetical protein